MENLLTFSRPLLFRLPNPNPNPNPSRNPSSAPNRIHFHLLHPETKTLKLPPRPRCPRLRLPPLCTATAAAFPSVSNFTTTFSALTTAISSCISPSSLSTTMEMFRPPINAAIAAFAKWLCLFREVLLIRVLLTWFPNINWEKQPFSALRDLSDPFIAIFGDIIPPFMGKLDVRPIIAFQVLEVVISILKTKQIM